ncbi:hypothetical protein L6Q96_09185 [Candidatus Binatia bacterium]|nr:hypothetical protein [Candidatus Binatia bacterium]
MPVPAWAGAMIKVVGAVLPVVAAPGVLGHVTSLLLNAAVPSPSGVWERQRVGRHAFGTARPWRYILRLFRKSCG